MKMLIYLLRQLGYCLEHSCQPLTQTPGLLPLPARKYMYTQRSLVICWHYGFILATHNQGGTNTITVTDTWIHVSLPVSYRTIQLLSFACNPYRTSVGPFASNWGGLDAVVLGVQRIEGQGTELPWISIGV